MIENNLYIIKSCLFMRKIVIILLLLISLVFPALASNETVISFSDLNLISSVDLEVYGLNTSSSQWEYLALLNSSSQGVSFEPGNYQVVLRPSAILRTLNPATFLTDIMAFAVDNAVPLVFILFLISILIAWGRK